MQGWEASLNADVSEGEYSRLVSIESSAVINDGLADNVEILTLLGLKLREQRTKPINVSFLFFALESLRVP